MFAYLDPASGSLILSAVAGGAAGAAVFAKSMGHKMKFWKKGDAEPEVDDDAAPDDETAVHTSTGADPTDEPVSGTVAETP